ncbi:3-hydroxyisobutyryl-coenzyme A hydrolase, putative [Plasmodium sp. gorilla clade G3]|nr:3-hydroxyisobutyryl-coenzyme A hydrolase, putative [Plasmodium sp. gorilla clade G3]
MLKLNCISYKNIGTFHDALKQQNIKFEKRNNFIFFHVFSSLRKYKLQHSKKNNFLNKLFFFKKEYKSYFHKLSNNLFLSSERKNEVIFHKMDKTNKNVQMIKHNIITIQRTEKGMEEYTAIDGKTKTNNNNNKNNDNNDNDNDNNNNNNNNNNNDNDIKANIHQDIDNIKNNMIDLELSELWSKKSLIVNFQNNICEIILNRPEKLNAINKDMINGLLNIIKSLDNDERCFMVIIRSTNINCFSSGSDVKYVIENKEQGIQHLKQLYLYINYISQMKKNLLCIWNGYVMGGGLGISIYSKYKVINNNAIFAMPENKIGFFPDIGCCYFFRKYFGRNIGLHLGLTSLRLNEVDLINFNVCNNYIENVDSFMDNLNNIKATNQEDFNKKLNNLLTNEYVSKMSYNKSNNPVLTDELINNINTYYSGVNNLEDLITKLKKDNNDFCKKLLSDIYSNCYFSCMFWFSYYLYNYEKSLEEVLNNDFKITQYFLFHKNSFERGVTEILVKKNKNFQWSKDEETNNADFEDIDDILMNKNLLSIREEFTNMSE